MVSRRLGCSGGPGIRAGDGRVDSLGRAFPDAAGDELERAGRDFLAGFGHPDHRSKRPSRGGRPRAPVRITSALPVHSNV